MSARKAIGPITKERMYDIIRSPVITEKSTLITQFNQVTFRVPMDATKPEIKQAVEGLSVVAISYYLTGLVKYLLEALDSGGVLPVDPKIATGFVMPVLIVLIVVGLRRIRTALDDRLDG